jgi:transcriptional regulator with XRE-family HTH domain
MAAESRNPRHGVLDAQLGERIRHRRRELGLSQSALGGKLGITFQQIQKYENGTNRVSATMLMKLSDALAMSVSDLLQQATPAAAAIDLESQTAELLAAFGRIPSQEVRAAILTLVAGLAQR